MKNYIIGVFVALVSVFVGVFIGSHQNVNQVTAGTSPNGSTFNSAKTALVVMTPATGSATSTGILNSSGNDYYIMNERVGCEALGTSKTAYSGAALAALLLTMSTSSSQTPNTNTNTNIVGTTAMTVGTSTGNFASASSTASNGATSPGSTYVGNIWATGSYLNMYWNATNTGVCTVGVEYISS